MHAIFHFLLKAYLSYASFAFLIVWSYVYLTIFSGLWGKLCSELSTLALCLSFYFSFLSKLYDIIIFILK